MTTIPNTGSKINAVSKSCERFIKRFKVNRLLRKVGATKEKGIPAYDVFAFLLGLVFSGKNLYTLISDSKESLSFGKDVIYRFLGKAFINWNTFVLHLSCSAVSDVDILTSDTRRAALVIDDTPYYRDRSKKVELLSKLYDHSNRRYYKGFELLTMGWTDGQTFMPIDYRVAANSDKTKLSEGPHIKKEDNRTLATKRRKDGVKEKPKLVLDMLKSVKGTAAEANYVLFDSWFSSPSAILNINKMGYNVVARLKDHKNFLYGYAGELMPISKIYAMNKKRRGKSRYLLSVLVEVRHKGFEQPIPAKIVYIRDRNNRKKWIALISTDTALSEDEIIALYGKRWDIEPFHKVIKSHLRLEKEFQTRSYDAIVAHTAIVMTRYIFLSLENRENKDLRSVNEGFRMLCDELEDISSAYSLELIISLFKQCCLDYIHLAKEQINALVDGFMSCLPRYIRDRLGVLVCES